MRPEKLEFLHKNLTVVLFVSILILCMTSIAIHFFQVVYTNINRLESKLTVVNWDELYPFTDEDTEEPETSVIDINPDHSIILTKLNSIINQVEQYSTEGILLRIPLVEFNSAISKLMGIISLNSQDGVVVRLNNGSLSFITSEYDSNGQAENLIEFNSYLKNKNIPLLYVQAPSKINRDNKQLPKGFYDFANENMDFFIGLISNNIDVLDLRESLIKYPVAHDDLFFKTDHHWKGETGRLAANEIMFYLTKEYGFEIDDSIYDDSSYNFRTYEDSFLGNEGKKMTRVYSELDDFTIITPNFTTDLNIEIPSTKLSISGAFEDIMYDYPKLESLNDYYNNDPYAAYLYGGKPLIQIHNNLLHNNKKVLLLRDSFASASAPFLALGAEDLHILDLRYFNGSLKAYIEEFQPDIVSILYSSGNLSNESAFKFK